MQRLFALSILLGILQGVLPFVVRPSIHRGVGACRANVVLRAETDLSDVGVVVLAGELCGFEGRSTVYRLKQHTKENIKFISVISIYTESPYVKFFNTFQSAHTQAAQAPE